MERRDVQLLDLSKAEEVESVGKYCTYAVYGRVCLANLRVGAKLHIFREADGVC